MKTSDGTLIAFHLKCKKTIALLKLYFNTKINCFVVKTGFIPVVNTKESNTLKGNSMYFAYHTYNYSNIDINESCFSI